jgi:tetratricopeptide (TPR) repeat protein
MQLCGKCGNHSSEEAIFCGHCANRLNNNCPSCGFKNLWEQKFCGSCGKQLLRETELPASMAVAQGGPVAPAPQPQRGPMPAGPSASSFPPSQGPAPQVVSATPIMNHSGQDAESARFEAQFSAIADLDAYGLLSIEFADWNQILAATPNPAALDEFRKQCLASLEERLLAANGQISGSKRGILFVAFKREANLQASLEQAIRVSQRLLALDFQYGELALKLRIGLDIEVAQARNPLTSTIERSMGQPGTLTASEAVYRQMQAQFRFATVGPVPLGNRNMVFYRLLREGGALPGAGEVLGETPGLSQATAAVPQAQPQIVQPTAPAPRAEPVQPIAPADVFPAEEAENPALVQSARIQEPAPPPMTEVLPPPQPETTAQHPFAGSMQEPAIPVQPVPPMQPSQAEAPVSPPEPAAEPPVPPPPAESSQAGAWAETEGQSEAPALPNFISPVLGLYKSPRKPNLSCEQAVDAVASELSGFLSQGVANNKGKIISICAADGLGKSSVVHLARQKIDPEGQRAFWMGAQHYRCFHRDGLPLIYWLELVQNLLSLVFEGQPAREVRERIEQFLTYIYDGACPTEEQALLEDFLSVNPPQPLSVEARGNLGRLAAFTFELFRVLTAKQPIVLVMEDLMYADPASLELLSDLLEHQLMELPIYIVLTMGRDFYAGGKLVDALQKCAYKELVIAEMTEPEAERFLDDGPLGGRLAEFPPAIIDGVIRQAKGVPLYLEEALRLLHLQEVLTVDMQTGKFILNQDIDALPSPLPDSIKALIRQRLAYLSEDALYVLEIAAVLGEKFAVNMLMALAQLEEGPFNEALTTLFNHGYILPDAVNTGRFRHGLLWETVYENMDVGLQVQVHQLVSETLENDFNQGVTVNPMLIAYHSENGELPNRAMNYWNLAGIFCGQVGSLLGMNMAMFRALEVLELAVPDQPLHTQELALRLVETLGIFNLEDDPDLAASLLEWAFFYRKSEGEAAKLIEPLGFLASAYENRGDLPRALATLDKALALIDRTTYPVEAASLLINKLEYQVIMGRIQQARDLLEREIEPVAQSPQAQREAEFQDAYLQAQLLKVQIMLVQCDTEAGAVLEAALQEARARGLEGMAIALQLLRGQIFLRHGQYESCDREADSLLTAIEAMAESDWFLAQWGLLAMMYHCDLQDWESASQLVLTVISKAEKVRDYHTWVIAQAYAGHISGKSGKIREARQLLEQAIKLSSSHRFAGAALLSWRFLGEFELDCQNAEVARELAERALEIADKPDIQHHYESMQLTLLNARALLALGRPKEAGKLLEPIWPRTTKTQLQPLIADCAFDIGMLYKQLAQNVPSDLSRKYLSRSVEFFLKAKGIWLDLRHLPYVKKVDAVMPRL